MGLGNFSISVNGMPLSPMVADQVVRVVVDTSMHMPSMFEIHIAEDPRLVTFPAIDSPMFKVGSMVSITATKQGMSETPPPLPSIPGVLIKGEVTALEPHFNADGTAVLVVRGYDKTHRLHRGRKTKTYLMMPIGTIVQQVLAASGLMGAVMPVPGLRQFELQNNMTDMEFLRMLANRVGYNLFMNELGVVQFKKSGIPIGAPVLLEWNKDLQSFHPRVASAAQVSQAVVTAWDPLMKQPVKGMSPVLPSTQGGAALLVELGASKAFASSAKNVTTNAAAGNVAEAMLAATAEAGKVAADFLQAEGVAPGNPGIKAGGTALITGVGLKYGGPYFITAVTHVYDEHGYLTKFRADGAEPKTFNQLVSGQSTQPGKVYGVVVGIVSNNLDPLGLGRVKVNYPFLQADMPISSDYIPVATPMAGPSMGLMIIPEVNDEVLVAFGQGDVNSPYIIGSVWNGRDKPPVLSNTIVLGGKVTKRVFKTPSGHTVTFDDSPSTPGISIVDKSMNKIEITSTQGVLNMEMKGNITFKSTTGDLAIECKNFSVKAMQDAKIEATGNLNMKATAGVKLDSDSTIAIKAAATLTAEGTASATLKTSAGQVAISGPAVNINNGALEIT